MLTSFSRSLSTTPAKLLNPADRIFTNIWGDQGADLKSAQARGSWTKTDEILSMTPKQIIDEVKLSEIRGRGGAGFATGTKWGFMAPPGDKPHYLCINADEGEPGTCKDRQILTNEPHRLVEGCLIASRALNAHTCYVYCRGEFRHEMKCLQDAIDEAYASGLIGKQNKFNYPFDMYIHSGAGAYVCGEETALLNSIEGKAGRPRFKPPFPAVKGLFGCPTIINNVETISSIPEIMKRGGKWYSSIGIPKSRGTKLFAISGCVNKPCVFEEAMGVSLKEIINKYCGGVRGGWDNIQAIIPGGLSCPPLTKEMADKAIMGYDELAALGTSLGTAAVIVLDKSVDIVKAYHRLSTFYAHESCGQCGPCREGTQEMSDLMDKIANGKGNHGDLKKLGTVAEHTTNCICALAAASSDPIKGLLKYYRPAVEKKLVD